ncbi:MAG: amidase [Snowella sp.]|nr:amidase [Snowella sp.]
MNDLAFSSALDLAKRIRQREISPLELTQFFLNRIEQYDSQLGSFFHVAAEMAIADAREKTEQLATTSAIDQLPPFFGVPTAIKDLNAVTGMPVTYGVAALRDNMGLYDDGVVTRMKQAGFVILGKTATAELGSFPYTEPQNFAPTRNPWHLDYTAGGSSGGAAAAVAAGLCPITQGSDGGGSVRGPAACCGLVGIKPSRGRVSSAPVGEFQSGIAAIGPLARTVADAAALLEVMSGYLTGDPYWLPDPEIRFSEAIHQSLPPLKVAFAYGVPPFKDTDIAGKLGVDTTVKQLESLGHYVESACFDGQGLIDPFTKIWQSGVAAAGLPLELLSPVNRWLGEQNLSSGDYLQATRQMHLASRQIVSFFNEFDVLVLPVYGHQPIKIGQWATLSPAETVQKITEWVSPCPPCNASGLPAIALPVGWDEIGLPIGVQLIGKPADEATLITLAAQLEAMNPHKCRRPPDFAE